MNLSNLALFIGNVWAFPCHWCTEPVLLWMISNCPLMHSLQKLTPKWKQSLLSSKTKQKKVFKFHVFILKHAIFLFKAYIMMYFRPHFFCYRNFTPYLLICNHLFIRPILLIATFHYVFSYFVIYWFVLYFVLNFISRCISFCIPWCFFNFSWHFTFFFHVTLKKKWISSL